MSRIRVSQAVMLGVNPRTHAEERRDARTLYLEDVIVRADRKVVASQRK